MLKDIIVTDELHEVMGLLYRLLDVRITFFDIRQAEHSYFDMKPMSRYCVARRRASAFNDRCTACDREHLATAKAGRDIHTYHCHDGLLEGVVPLYDRRNLYIGAIVFGQLRDPDRPPPAGLNARQRALYMRLPAYTAQKVRDIGALLKCVSEYIIGNELVQRPQMPWVEQLDSHIEANLNKPLTLTALAATVGKSPSFLSHHFRTQFGLSPRQYIIKRRLEEARLMLERGESVQATADSLGFFDAFHFSKVFRKYWGRPPKSFRSA